MKRIPWHIFPTAFSSCPSDPLSLDLSPDKTHDSWLQDLMKVRLRCLIAKIQLEMQQPIRDGFVGFREKHTPQGVGHCRGKGLLP